tara:strand:+ start:472 stop:1539 length:1068 start_codon:yes stop_codon:yes gene_type:complete
MGNTPSNENGIDRDAFIEEQKRIIREQNEQIQRLASIAENSMGNQQTSQQRQPKREEFHPSFVQDKPKDKKKINPYHVLGVGENYDESSLKKAYLSRAMETHPDRGGSKEEFQKVTVCYKALMIKLRERENNHEHNELRENSTDFMRNQSSDNFQNRDLSKNFDQNAFNRIYEENRMEDIHDQGYEKWMKENQATSDDIIHDTSLTKDNFNNRFSKQKQQHLRKTGNQIQKYTEPIEEISYKNKSSIMMLGRDKIDNFSGESGGLSYRDYKDAYTNPFLVNDDDFKNVKKPKDLKAAQSERENISYEMSEEDVELYALKKIREEKEEELRIKRLMESDKKSEQMYDRVHQRMLGY